MDLMFVITSSDLLYAISFFYIVYNLPLYPQNKEKLPSCIDVNINMFLPKTRVSEYPWKIIMMIYCIFVHTGKYWINNTNYQSKEWSFPRNGLNFWISCALGVLLLSASLGTRTCTAQNWIRCAVEEASKKGNSNGNQSTNYSKEEVFQRC